MTDTTTAGAATATAAGERIAALAGALQAIMDFYLTHPDAPAPYDITLTSISVASRAELDALAGEFDQPPPPPAEAYHGAQFYVRIGDGPIGVSAIYSFHEDRR
jgi:hypothetical protein